ncbi:MAG: adenosyl-hopene transferase HpnH [Deltaproteobacteria bacterium]|nr:adenosyl-hopene transferase HpnH [Deltaproteobacteria bacterium]MBW2047118.1 adenosyl-hopene transferase HpnH [Deltaproteobacteria bacterium]MBW2109924.1 adenosyl-hopene transferase HpnH [Deltaproteobacteria bacterium]MBW2351853.1 adenosyl-hopene transferase HpnH [Deltaproteobacteria bacterium]HDZ90762.1 adenosyl-hopene transferase HpnH [Deltaproteobacteria bacterium]
MGIPLVQKARLSAYIFTQRLRHRERFPLVLMLEPLFRCNLRCRGCGKIGYPAETLRRSMTPEECITAVEECGAPVVSIAGGEPLLHPEIAVITRELVARKKFVYLCTNSLLVEKRIREFEPSPYLTFNVHLDAMNQRHDERVGLPGVFDVAVSAIRMLLSRDFRVTTNTTIFKGETAESAGELFDLLTGLGVEAMTVASAFNYENAPDQENFFIREEAVSLFRSVLELGRGKSWRFNHTSLYLDFLAGNQDYACLPWGNPTRNIFGWQRPCYLLNDGYEPTFQDLMKNTDWSRYGAGRDPRCAHCMLHCGFEPTAVVDSVKHPLKALRASFRLR